jgi:CRISPR/Cas system CMR subunit Cmr4 (Cas7 group RAMP superfamily)
VEYGNPGTYFGGLVRKTGPIVACSGGSRSRVDGPLVRRSVDLPLICAGGSGCLGYVFIGIP